MVSGRTVAMVHVPVAAHHRVVDVHEPRLDFLENHLLVRKRGFALRVPVDHPDAPVNQSFVVEPHEHLHHGFVVGRVHRETGAAPVAGRAEFFELFEDDAAVFLFPLEGMFEKPLPAHGFLAQALLLQHGYHPRLGGDGGVVGAGHPEGFPAFHARLPDEDVLNRVVEHVAHVQHAGHVGRRDDDGVGFFFRVRLGGEQLVFQPVGVPLVLNVLGLVSFGNAGFRSHARCGLSTFSGKQKGAKIGRFGEK